MSEENAAEVTSDIQTLSSDNMDEFMSARLNLAKEAETAADADVVEEPAESAEEESEEVVEAEKKPEKKRSGLEQRMHELTSKAKAEKERADALEARLQALQKPAEPEVKQPEAKTDKPRPDQFADAFEYAEALSEWKVAEAFRVREEQDQAKKQDDVRKQVVYKWETRLTETKAQIEDFDEVMSNSPVKVSDPVRDVIVESELGPQLAYYLASNPEEADRINALPVARQLAEIGKIEARLEPKSESDADPKPKPEVKASKAPPPISPIKAKTTIETKESPDGEWTGSYDEYKAARLAGKIK